MGRLLRCQAGPCGVDDLAQQFVQRMHQVLVHIMQGDAFGRYAVDPFDQIERVCVCREPVMLCGILESVLVANCCRSPAKVF